MTQTQTVPDFSVRLLRDPWIGGTNIFIFIFLFIYVSLKFWWKETEQTACRPSRLRLQRKPAWAELKHTTTALV